MMREMSKELLTDAKSVGKRDISGYFIIGWDRNGCASIRQDGLLPDDLTAIVHTALSTDLDTATVHHAD